MRLELLFFEEKRVTIFNFLYWCLFFEVSLFFINLLKDLFQLPSIHLAIYFFLNIRNAFKHAKSKCYSRACFLGKKIQIWDPLIPRKPNNLTKSQR